MKTKTVKLAAAGNQGFHPQVAADDLVTNGGRVADSADVSFWLLTRLGQIHDQAKDLINQHLATLRYNGQKPR